MDNDKQYEDRIRFDRVTWGEVQEVRSVSVKSLDVDALSEFEARVGGLLVDCIGQIGLIEHGIQCAESDDDIEKRRFPLMHYKVKVAALAELHARIRAETELQPVFVYQFPASGGIGDLVDRITGDDLGEFD